MITLGGSLGEVGSLAKVSQLGWLDIHNKGMPSGFAELGTALRVVHNGVIRRECGQTVGLGLVDRNRTVVIISLQQMEST